MSPGRWRTGSEGRWASPHDALGAHSSAAHESPLGTLPDLGGADRRCDVAHPSVSTLACRRSALEVAPGIGLPPPLLQLESDELHLNRVYPAGSRNCVRTWIADYVLRLDPGERLESRPCAHAPTGLIFLAVIWPVDHLAIFAGRSPGSSGRPRANSPSLAAWTRPLPSRSVRPMPRPLAGGPHS